MAVSDTIECIIKMSVSVHQNPITPHHDHMFAANLIMLLFSFPFTFRSGACCFCKLTKLCFHTKILSSCQTTTRQNQSNSYCFVPNGPFDSLPFDLHQHCRVKIRSSHAKSHHRFVCFVYLEWHRPMDSSMHLKKACQVSVFCISQAGSRLVWEMDACCFASEASSTAIFIAIITTASLTQFERNKN